MAVTYGLVNHSATVTKKQAQIMAQAIDEHLEHFAAAWPSLTRSQCMYIAPNQERTLANRPNVWPIFIVDGFPPALTGAGGVHIVTGAEASFGLPPQTYPISGRPVGYVTTVVDFGFGPPLVLNPFSPVPDPIYPPSTYPSIAGVVGHEATEMASDPYDLTYTPSPPFTLCAADHQQAAPPYPFAFSTEGSFFQATHAIMEAGDPSGRNFYTINVGPQAVSVQDFPTAEWFRLDYWCNLNAFPINELPGAPVFAAVPPPPGTKYSYLNLLPGPFEFPLTGGGYIGLQAASSTGKGDDIVPPDYVNPLFGPICAGFPAPPVPGPGQHRVALDYPGWGVRTAFLFVPPAFLTPDQYEGYAKRHTTMFVGNANPAINYGPGRIVRP